MNDDLDTIEYTHNKSDAPIEPSLENEKVKKLKNSGQLNSSVQPSDYTETPQHGTKKKSRNDVNVSSMIASVDSNNMKLNMDIILEKCGSQ